jgi:hypothetical protein
MLIETAATDYRRLFAANSTATSVVAPVPTTTPPAPGDGVIELAGPDGVLSSSGVKLLPYGAGADNNTFSLGVFGWSVVRPTAAGEVPLWVATPLATYTSVTMNSGMPGLANTAVNASQMFCDAATIGIGNAGVSVELVAGAGNGPLHLIVDTKGFRFLEVRFDKGTATSCNALWGRL